MSSRDVLVQDLLLMQTYFPVNCKSTADCKNCFISYFCFASRK